VSTRAQLSESLNRLLPGEANKRIRNAILEAATYSGQRTDQLRRTIDEANRIQTGILINGTLEITTDTNANLSGWAWASNFAVQQQDGSDSITILAPDDDFVRADYFIGMPDGLIEYRPSTIDPLGNSMPPAVDPAEVILRIIQRNPDGSTEEVDTDGGRFPDTEYFTQADFDTTGLYAPVWRARVQPHQSFILQLDYAAPSDSLNWNTSPSARSSRLNLAIYCQGGLAVTGIFFETFGGGSEDGDWALVRDGDELTLYHKSVTVWMRVSFRATLLAMAATKSQLLQAETYATLPTGDQVFHSTSFTGGTNLDSEIVDALDAALPDSPGTLNRFVTVSLLNSYSYVQEAPINGNHHARKDGAWVAFTPFTVAGTPTNGHVVTLVAGVPTWQAPSGGGGISGLTTNRIIKATSATSVGDTGITEESAISYLFGTRASAHTATPLRVSFGGTFGNNAVGSSGNLKWLLYDDGTANNFYGIGMSSGLMEFRAGIGGKIGFFPNNGADGVRFSHDSFTTRVEINHETNSGFRLFRNGVGRWSVATYNTTSDFAIYNETLARNSIYVRGNNNRTVITELGDIPSDDLGYTLYVVANAAGLGLVSSGQTWLGGDLQIIKNSGPQAAPTAIQMGSSFGNSTPGSAANLKWKLYTTTGFPANANDYGIGMTAGLMEFRAGAGASLGFFPNNGVELMRLISGGFVVIGVTTNPANTRFTVRGLGNATGVTQLWEALDGTDNVRFLDNGQILFLRLPTSASGLATGTLWKDAGTLKVA
jgi:hypothetical protein